VSDDPRTPGAGEPPTFERALTALDEVVRRLEEGVALFEEGQRHLAVCRTRLAAAERRIEELTADELPRDPGAPEEGVPPF